jgi:hypothetical protein
MLQGLAELGTQISQFLTPRYILTYYGVPSWVLL